MAQSVITAYEHGTLRCGQHLNDGQFEAIARYHDQTGSKWFSLGHRSVRFSNYIGILGVGGLVIEILPKLDANAEPAKCKLWRGVLCDMLAYCGRIRPSTVERVRQAASKHTLLDIFITQFLEEVESLCRMGLIKVYRSECCSINALRGRLDFPRHLVRNGQRPDRWFTDHNVYDRNNPFNGVLKQALIFLDRDAPQWSRGRIRTLLFDLDGVSPVMPGQGFIERLCSTRNTTRYRTAIELAVMIIQGFAPDLGPGRHDVFALMFDMNKVFEEYLYQALRREGSRRQPQILCNRGEYRPFWRRMSLAPDIVARVGSGPCSCSTFILDAKWKCPQSNSPDPADLRQVLAYNLYFDSRKAFLVYPSLQLKDGQGGDFKPMSSLPSYRHSCETHFIRLIDDKEHLCRKFAPLLLERMLVDGGNGGDRG